MCLVQVGKTRGVPKGAGKPHPAPQRKTGIFGRLSRMSGNLNPFEEEEANPRHQQNLHMTVGKVGECQAAATGYLTQASFFFAVYWCCFVVLHELSCCVLDHRSRCRHVMHDSMTFISFF